MNAFNYRMYYNYYFLVADIYMNVLSKKRNVQAMFGRSSPWQINGRDNGDA